MSESRFVVSDFAPMDCSPWNSQAGENTGGSGSFLQGSSSTIGSNSGLSLRGRKMRPVMGVRGGQMTRAVGGGRSGGPGVCVLLQGPLSLAKGCPPLMWGRRTFLFTSQDCNPAKQL